jgi:hypothetical protein
MVLIPSCVTASASVTYCHHRSLKRFNFLNVVTHVMELEIGKASLKI